MNALEIHVDDYATRIVEAARVDGYPHTRTSADAATLAQAYGVESTFTHGVKLREVATEIATRIKAAARA